MGFADFALRNARGLLALLVVLVALGLGSIGRLPMSIYPKISFARVVVVAQNGQMPPTQMQQNITRPIEQAVSTIVGVKLVQSNSAQGSSLVSITFDPSIDVNVDLQRVNSVVADLRSNLPPNTDVQAQYVNPNIFPVLGYTIAVPGKTNAEIRALAEFTIKPALTGIDGVAQIRIVGGRRPEYWVSVDPERAASRGIDIDKLTAAIAANNAVTAVGHFNGFGQSQIVLVSGAPQSPSDVAKIVVESRGGVPITVGDVATVHDALALQTALVSSRSRDTVLLNVYAQPGGNISQVDTDVAAALRREAPTLGAGASIRPYWNQAILVNDSVKSLRDSILIGTLLSVAVMWFFLGSIRSTLVAATVIPLTIATAFLFMRLFDQGLNLMTLGGLAIGVGLVIVDAIFVVENIYRHLQEGVDRFESVRRGMAEIATPMIGSTVTTIVVFAPLALLSGVTGAFFIALSITLATALALSLFFALFITPLLSAYFLRAPKRLGEAPRHPGARSMNWLLRRYEPGLRWLLRRPIVAFAGAAAILVLTGVIGSGLGSDFLPEMDEGAFEFNFTMPPGTSLGETDRALKQAEAVIGANPNVVGYARLTGLDPSGFFPAPPNAGNIRATMLERDKRKDGVDAILDDIRRDVGAKVPILKFSITQILQDLLNDLSNTPGTIEIKILGSDETRLEAIAKDVDDRIAKVPGVVDDFDGIVYSTPDTLVRLKPLAGSRAGFTTTSLTAAVQAGFDGVVATTIPRLPLPVPVRVRYAVPWNDLSLRDLQTLPVVAPNGSSYSLSSLADVVALGTTTERNEENLEQIVRVTANVSGRDLGGTIADIRTALRGVRIPEGYRLVYGGRYALQQQSFAEFGTAIAIAILLVFITMVFEFRGFRIPIVVISSVPLALFGVVIALRVTNIPLNVSSFMGLILLVGGVVKNGILLFDEVDKSVVRGDTPEEAMVRAGRTRMRPIIMTTLTSLLGVVPLAIGLGAGSEMQKPLAVATIGGLVFSTFFTLYLMPAFYVVRKKPRSRIDDSPQALPAKTPAVASVARSSRGSLLRSSLLLLGLAVGRAHAASAQARGNPPPNPPSAAPSAAPNSAGTAIPGITASPSAQPVPSGSSEGASLTGTISLETALSEAERRSPDIIAADAAVAIARARSLQAAIAPLQFVAQPALAEDVPGGMGQIQQLSSGVQQQIVPGVRIAKRLASFDVAAAGALAQQTRRDVRGRVIDAYYALGSARARSIAADDNLTSARQLVEAANLRQRAGAVGTFEVLRASVEARRAQSEVLQARGSLRQTAIALGAAIGGSVDAGAAVSLEPVAPAGSLDRAAAVERALAGDPTSEQLRTILARSRVQYDAARALRLPTFSLSGGFVFQRAPQIGNRTSLGPTASVGVSIPIYDYGTIRGGELEALANSDATRAQLSGREIQLRASIAAAAEAVDASRARFDFSIESQRQAQEGLRIAQIGFRQGALGTLDVISARTAVTTSGADRDQARSDYAAAVAKLHVLLGDPLTP